MGLLSRKPNDYEVDYLEFWSRMAIRHVRATSLKYEECPSQASLQKGVPHQFHILNSERRPRDSNLLS
jgi:hypothetical protein